MRHLALNLVRGQKTENLTLENILDEQELKQVSHSLYFRRTLFYSRLQRLFRQFRYWKATTND